MLPSGDAAAATDSGAFIAALTAFAGVRSESQLISTLQNIMASLFGAQKTVLVTRAAELAGIAHETARLGVHPADPEIEERMARGAIFVSSAPAADFAALPVPGRSLSGLLVPCSSIGAVHAICAFWGEPPRRLHPPELDRLRALATVVGLAFDRYLADARARIDYARTEHRMRNLLAMLRSIGARSAKTSSVRQGFLPDFEGRMDAIGRSAIESIVGSELSFETLLREEFRARGIREGDALSLAGTDVMIGPEQAAALRLAVHELAVNAVKFGALGTRSGSLTVRWWVEGGAEMLTLNIDWQEQCLAGKAAAIPAEGFGFAYLRRGLRFQLNAETTLQLGPRGLTCQISVPLAKRPARAPQWPAGADDRVLARVSAEPPPASA